jgi:pilus assembly protein CpaB
VTNKLALIVAVVLGALSIVLIYKRIEGIKREYEASAQLVPLLVASRNIQAGSVVSPGDVGTIDMPSQALQQLAKTYYQTADRNLVENRKALSDIKQGQIFQNYHFEQSAGGKVNKFRLQGNLRALTVSVSPTNGLAGMLRPGDSIDIVVTQEFAVDSPSTLPGAPKEKIRVTRVLLKKIPIVATDGNTEASSAYSDYSTITLTMPPEDVNRFYFASDSGAAIHFIKTDDATVGNTAGPHIANKDFEEIEPQLKAMLNKPR